MQYKHMREDRKSSLTQNRRQVLENIGFSWSVNKTTGRKIITWMDQYNQLKAFKYFENHCRIPKKIPKTQRWKDGLWRKTRTQVGY